MNYVRKHGPLNPLRRLDGNLAEIARLIAIAANLKKSGGGKWELTDFCRWGSPVEPKPIGSDAAFAMFAAFAKPKEP